MDELERKNRYYDLGRKLDGPVGQVYRLLAQPRVHLGALYNAAQKIEGEVKTRPSPDTIELVQYTSGVLRENGYGALSHRMLASISAREKPKSDEQPSGHEFIAFASFADRIRLVSLLPDGTYRYLDDAQNLHNIIYVSSETRALQIAVDELETLVNEPSPKEKDFQDFFERYPEFILNDDYKKAHPHIVLTKDEDERLIPDFVLEPIDQGGLCDLLELKLPSAQIYVLQKKRMRFSAAVLEACAQLREYRMFFDEKENRNRILEKFGLLAFKPKMIVIIGRRGSVNPIDVRKIESDIPNIHLRTYDEVIACAKAKVDRLRRGRFRF